MEQIGKKFLDIPGDSTRVFELPPLLISSEVGNTDCYNRIFNIVNEDDLVNIPESVTSDIKMYDTSQAAKECLAANLSNVYTVAVTNWHLGECILEWVYQCEITFSNIYELKFLVRPNVWPNTERRSIAELLTSKGIYRSDQLKFAVGMRLSFRKPPPVECLSDHFLYYLGSVATKAAYDAWSERSPQQLALPPERFHFDVIDI